MISPLVSNGRLRDYVANLLDGFLFNLLNNAILPAFILYRFCWFLTHMFFTHNILDVTR